MGSQTFLHLDFYSAANLLLPSAQQGAYALWTLIPARFKDQVNDKLRSHLIAESSEPGRDLVLDRCHWLTADDITELQAEGTLPSASRLRADPS